MGRTLFTSILVAICGLCLINPRIVDACGFQPYSEEAEDREAGLLALLRAEPLPLLSPQWHSEYWVIAWARVHGKAFDDAEVASLIDDPNWLRLSPDPALSSTVGLWMSTREPFNAPMIGAPVPHRSGSHYQHHVVCGPDAFLTAAQTLTGRAATGYSVAEIGRWITAQDQVFALCSDPNLPLPESLSESDTLLARQDRAYQRAVAMTYAADSQPDRERAIEAFEDIAISESPWADIARYRSAFIRVGAGGGDLNDLRQRLALTSDPKARRGLVQLIDRVGLFNRPAAEVVQVLSQRLLLQSLGADLPRTLRDIVYFAKRIPEGACVDGLSSVVSGRAACRPATAILARLRRVALTSEVPPMPGRLLEINRRFHVARRHLEAGRHVAARRQSARLLRLAQHSNAATQNAAHALALATARNPAQVYRHALRRSVDGPVLHRDGQRAFAQLSMHQWRRALAGTAFGPPPATLVRRIATEGLIRSVLLGNPSQMRAFGGAIVHTMESGDSWAAAVQSALVGSAAELRISLLLALLVHDPAELSIADEFQEHSASLQASGCTFGTCGDAHPHETSMGAALAVPSLEPSRSRRRVTARGRRINAIGELVLSLAAVNEGDARTPALLHHFVALTRRASIHRETDSRTGGFSRRAFTLLHQRHPEDAWTARTSYWYR